MNIKLGKSIVFGVIAAMIIQPLMVLSVHASSFPQRVNVASDGTQANDFTSLTSSSAISADGRYVTFSSMATNLVPGDANGSDYSHGGDVFVYDRQTGETSCVSVASDGARGNDYSDSPVISADGRYVAFTSIATNLVPGDTNASDPNNVSDMNHGKDIFIHDRQTGETSRLSVASDGLQGNDNSEMPAISADGRYVAFFSLASNLVSGDTNRMMDVFLRDRQTGETSRVSVASDGSQGGKNSHSPTISADGRYVAFISEDSNLVPGDTNNTTDVFIHDRQTGETSRVSVASDKTQENIGSFSGSISADGRFIAFSSYSSNLVPGDTNGQADIFIHDRQTGETSRVDVTSSGAQGQGTSSGSAISADGRYVSFYSEDPTLVPGDTNGLYDVFVRDRQTNETYRVGISQSGQQGNGKSVMPAISADGSYIAYSSDASNLVGNDTNNVRDDFVVENKPISVTSNTFQVGDATLWLGLKNNDGKDTQFDIKTGIYLNNTLVSGGQETCVVGVAKGQSLAKQITVPFDNLNSVNFNPGDTLSFKVLTRIGTNADGTQCDGHNNASGLGIYFDSIMDPSRISMSINSGSMTSYYLDTIGGNYILNPLFPTGTTSYVDSAKLHLSQGNPWEEIGTWNMQL